MAGTNLKYFFTFDIFCEASREEKKCLRDKNKLKICDHLQPQTSSKRKMSSKSETVQLWGLRQEPVCQREGERVHVRALARSPHPFVFLFFSSVPLSCPTGEPIILSLWKPSVRISDT